jgi:signal transduction histidine kinase
LEPQHIEALQERLDRLHLEIAELRASRRRLVLAADADRHMIERELHEGLQQHLVALAVKLQLASQLIDGDRTEAKALLEEISRDVQQALYESTRLAVRIDPPLLETGGLAATLRAAVVNGGITASVDVAAQASYPPGIARTVYLCCLEALAHTRPESRPTISVRDEGSVLAFDVISESARPASADSDARFERLGDRVEALGGRLTVESTPGRGLTVRGSLPLAR